MQQSCHRQSLKLFNTTLMPTTLSPLAIQIQRNLVALLSRFLKVIDELLPSKPMSCCRGKNPGCLGVTHVDHLILLRISILKISQAFPIVPCRTTLRCDCHVQRRVFVVHVEIKSRLLAARGWKWSVAALMSKMETIISLRQVMHIHLRTHSFFL